MKNRNAFAVLLFLTLILSFNILHSQNIDFNNYRSLKSYGNIPEVVRKSLSLSNEELITRQTAADDKNTAKGKKSFLLENDCEIFQLIRNGDVLFGDPVGLYITKVAKELLKNNPQLFSELNFFAIKNPAVNAFSNNNGFVFVDIGLLANLETESELATILAHEIAHYIKKHPMEAHLENMKILNSRNSYGFKSKFQVMDFLGKRSRNSEYEADSIGISLLLASSYNPEAIDRTMNCLHYSSHPFSDNPFDTRFFNDGEFRVPECYFLDSCSKLSPIKDSYDENYSHPNMFKRKVRAANILARSSAVKGSDFLVSETEFNSVREISRFELIHLDVRNEDYGDAIYNAYSLLKKYPGNKYLELCIAESLYGLTKYKDDDKFFYVAKPYEKAEGESQQVHYFLRQLNRKQLNVLSVKYIQKLIKKYPEAVFLDKLETDLVNEMIVKNNIDFERLMETGKEEKNVHPDTTATKQELQKLNEKFWCTAFAEEFVNDTSFIRKCADARNKKKLDGIAALRPPMVKKELEKKAMLDIRKNGLKTEFGKLIILDPYIELDMRKLEKEYQHYENNKMELDQMVITAANGAGLKPDLISLRDISVDTTTDKYNQLCMYRELLGENMTHDMDVFYPVGSEYFCNETSGIKNILCYIGIFNDFSGDNYYFSYIDLSSGETIYRHEETLLNVNTSELKKYFREDFQVLTK